VCEFSASQQRILHNPNARFEQPKNQNNSPNDGAVSLWGHDLPRHQHDLERFGAGHHSLWHVHIHLIAVKVGVVRSGAAQIQPVSFE